MPERGKEYIAGRTEYEAPAAPALAKRAHVRVVLPPEVRVYCRVRHAGSTVAGARGMVSDISVGGLALTMTEGMRFEPPRGGSEVHLELDYGGGEAQARARVVRAAAQQMSVAFSDVSRDRDLNGDLLSLLARIVTRRVDHLDRGPFSHALQHPFTHERFHGAGYLDIRVAPTWWQMVFLDYVISWSQGGAVTTGSVDRSTAAALPADPLRVQPMLRLHDQPWVSLKKVANMIAARCAAVLPDHLGSFNIIARAL